VTAGELRAADEVVPGGGGVMRDGLKKIALYRDDQGKVHAFSALCPHLGCVVAWNAAEKTWDCPCHGSRFDALGEVVNGPARTGLDRLIFP
jgi:Rieske Fe-S protein